MTNRTTLARGVGTGRGTLATWQPKVPKLWGKDQPRAGARARMAFATGIVLCLALAAALPVEAQELDWAKRAGDSSEGQAIATDGAGNSYVTGKFHGSATFGPGEANQTTLTSAGATTSLSPSTTQAARWSGPSVRVEPARPGLWHRERMAPATATSPETSPARRRSARRGQPDHAYRRGQPGHLRRQIQPERRTSVGQTRGRHQQRRGRWHRDRQRRQQLRQRGIRGHGDVRPRRGQPDHAHRRGQPGHLRRQVRCSGALVWAKRAGGTSSDGGRGIATDGAGNSYVSGRFSGTATFGLGEANQTTLTSAGGPDIFVAKYDPSGALIWAKRAGGTQR